MDIYIVIHWHISGSHKIHGEVLLLPEAVKTRKNFGKSANVDQQPENEDGSKNPRDSDITIYRIAVKALVT